MFELRTILHATDFSDASRPALDHALIWAELFEAKLLLLHVETPRTAGAAPPSAALAMTSRASSPKASGRCVAR